MAKAKKYPKRPKASAGLSVWTSYEQKCKDVDKANAAAEKMAMLKKKIIERTKR